MGYCRSGSGDQKSPRQLSLGLVGGELDDVSVTIIVVKIVWKHSNVGRGGSRSIVIATAPQNVRRVKVQADGWFALRIDEGGA